MDNMSAALIKKDDKVLIVKRPNKDAWEFPSVYATKEKSKLAASFKNKYGLDLKVNQFVTNNLFWGGKNNYLYNLYQCDILNELPDKDKYKYVSLSELLNYDLDGSNLHFAKYLHGVNIEDIKTPEDVLVYMKNHIQYGWLDINGLEHIGNMKDFRRLYRTSSIEDTISHGMGTCIEQVYLMHTLLDKLNIKNKMFATRIYEGEDFDMLDCEEHMHCFLLYYLDNKVYQLEHPNFAKVGIYEYDSEEEALELINYYYVARSGGISRPVTEFFEVEEGLSFKDFNLYINGLDKEKEQRI